jgi:hypothetical protein
LLVRAYAWILLKYRPECWWFELPLLAYKVSSFFSLSTLSPQSPLCSLLSLLSALFSLSLAYNPHL